MSRESVDLYEYYDEDKRRKTTYVQMSELMLREVRKGRLVVGAFHGHPGFFVFPARRALAIASAEGYQTAMIPAISAPDCMFADLRVDPGRFGCQILMASRVFSADVIVATTGHVVFLQVSAVGDRRFSYSGYKDNKLGLFFERLIEFTKKARMPSITWRPYSQGWSPKSGSGSLRNIEMRRSSGQFGRHAVPAAERPPFLLTDHRASLHERHRIRSIRKKCDCRPRAPSDTGQIHSEDGFARALRGYG